MANHVLKHEADALRERERLARIQDYQDPPTTRFLEVLGVAEGWNCLDVGAGAGSINAWLATRVAPTGTVLATEPCAVMTSGTTRSPTGGSTWTTRGQA